jgi:hypothetical protein
VGLHPVGYKYAEERGFLINDPQVQRITLALPPRWHLVLGPVGYAFIDDKGVWHPMNKEWHAAIGEDNWYSTLDELEAELKSKMG